MRPSLFALTLLLAACTDKDDEVVLVECAKVLCAPDEYCLEVVGGEPPDSGAPYEERTPECTAAPPECGGKPSCDCLEECTECSEEDGVFCTILAP